MDTNFVKTNPLVLGGTPVFAGTRMPVRILFEYIETGETIAEFLDEFLSVLPEMPRWRRAYCKRPSRQLYVRILLDESLPRKLGFVLPKHPVRTVQTMGWSGLVNGQLLITAAGEFDVLITGDQNVLYQQNATQLPLSVVVLIAPNNKLESFLPLVGKLIGVLDNLR